MSRFLQALPGLLLVASLLFSFRSSSGQTFEANVPSTSAVVDSVAQKHMAEKPIPGLSLAVVQDGRIVQQSTYGVADLASMRPATDSTIYQLASVTKIFTGIGVMMLVEDGLIALGDSVHKHLPGLPDAWRGVTVRQAVSHTSGLPDMLDENGDPLGGGDTEQAWTLVQEKPLASAPGKVWRYNQTGPEVIRRIAEQVTGQSWESFIKEHVFEPSGMHSTYFLYEPPPDSARVATGYNLEDGSLLALDFVEAYDYYIPTAAGIFSTAGDLARLSMALASGRLISRSSREAMWTPPPHEEGGLEGWGSESGYAIGWIVDTDQDRRRVWHSGGGMTTLHHYPEDGLTVIVLTNLSGADPNAIANDIAGNFL